MWNCCTLWARSSRGGSFVVVAKIIMRGWSSASCARRAWMNWAHSHIGRTSFVPFRPIFAIRMPPLVYDSPTIPQHTQRQPFAVYLAAVESVCALEGPIGLVWVQSCWASRWVTDDDTMSDYWLLRWLLFATLVLVYWRVWLAWFGELCWVSLLRMGLLYSLFYICSVD